ncbi:MAG TPA: CBS domain-containing protein [Anaerolineae bacterium]|nr:CBS domain-containing protein [Anaerolineae bacterium]
MLVRDYMTRHPLMAQPTMPIVEAQRYMGENNIRHLPVVGDGKRLLGLVTRQTLLVDPGRLGSLDLWEITRTLTELTVKDVMIKAKSVVTVSQDATVEEAACIMVAEKIGGLPVLEDDIVIGIITDTDLLAHLTELLGEHVPGVRVTYRMPEKLGSLVQVTEAIADHGWGIYGGGYVVTPRRAGYWDYVVKVREAPKEELVKVLEQIEDLEIIDVREMI